jgi:vacuolar-type H+-ATPase subunit I/STV1
MKTFKTVEEMVEYVSDKTNIETFDSGEVTLKDWIKLDTSATKYKTDHGLALKDKETLKRQKEEANKQIAELTEQLKTVNTELAGLQEIHSGNDKEALQKLNKEKSEWISKYNVEVSKNKELEKQIAVIPDLEKKVETFQVASNRSRIVAEARKEAAKLSFPQHIIDDPDFERNIADDFTIDEAGGIFTKGDTPQSMANHLATKQKEKPHWNPTSEGAGIDTMKATSGAFAGEGDLSSCFTT